MTKPSLSALLVTLAGLTLGGCVFGASAARGDAVLLEGQLEIDAGARRVDLLDLAPQLFLYETGGCRVVVGGTSDDLDAALTLELPDLADLAPGDRLDGLDVDASIWLRERRGSEPALLTGSSRDVVVEIEEHPWDPTAYRAVFTAAFVLEDGARTVTGHLDFGVRGAADRGAGARYGGDSDWVIDEWD